MENVKTSNLFLEVGVEDIPSYAFSLALKQLREKVADRFNKERLNYKDIYCLGTCRRLVVYVNELNEKQIPLRKEIFGPPKSKAYDKANRPTSALLGFIDTYKASPKDIKILRKNKGEYVGLIKEESGRATSEILKEILPEIILGISFPKSMYWEEKDIKFIRPIRWICCFLGTKLIKFKIGSIKTEKKTYGHFFLTPSAISLKEAVSLQRYKKILANKFVIVDPEERKSLIKKGIQQKIKKINSIDSVSIRIHKEENLINEITTLVEYPTAILGKFEEKYLSLPPEVLITCLKHYQKFFVLETEKEEILPYFIGIRDGISEYMEVVRKGYEAVVKARLEDAQFFFNQDLKKEISKYVEDLKGIVFHERLGSLYDKTLRIVSISEKISSILHLSIDTIENIKKIAFLSKADISTKMVYEFPELRGTMGKIYATFSKENKIIAESIEQHYWPLPNEDSMPSSIEATVVSLADRFDTLYGYFSLGIIPTGSEDPYGLKSESSAIVRMLENKELNCSWVKIVDFVEKEYENILSESEKVKQKLIEFLKQRIELLFEQKGFSYDEIRAAMEVGFENIYNLHLRLKALVQFRNSEKFKDLILMCKRARNIIKQAEKKGVLIHQNIVIKQELLYEKEEKDLFYKITEVERSISGNRDYYENLCFIVDIAPYINKFFDKVLVMCENNKIKNNRLAILNKILSLSYTIGDFAKISYSLE